MESVTMSSPRMWGCFPFQAPASPVSVVFPTHVGVFPPAPCGPCRWACLPHACGGVSYLCASCGRELASSPRMWGCFLFIVFIRFSPYVFPTHVGVFPKASPARLPRQGLPHACGGVSEGSRKYIPDGESSPRMWGCFHRRERQSASFEGLPHACGGVSKGIRYTSGLQMSSPRMWGCF